MDQETNQVSVEIPAVALVLPPDLAPLHARCVQGWMIVPSAVKNIIEELAAKRIVASAAAGTTNALVAKTAELAALQAAHAELQAELAAVRAAVATSAGTTA